MKKTQSVFFGFAAVLMTAIFTLAGCGDGGSPKGPLEGVWTATYEDEVVHIAFVGDKFFFEGEGFYTYTYEKNTGTAEGEYDSMSFSVNGSSLTLDWYDEPVVFTKDTNSKTPGAIRGLWTGKDDDGDEMTLAFVNDVGIIAYAFIADIYPYVFDKNKDTVTITGSDDNLGGTVNGNKLILEGGGDKISFTRVTAKKAPAAAGAKALIGTWESDYGLTWSFTGNKFTQSMMGIKQTVPYKIKGNAISTKYEGAEVEMDFEVDGDTLTIDVMGFDMEFTRVGK